MRNGFISGVGKRSAIYIYACAMLLVAHAGIARAGLNVWTSHGPPRGIVQGLVIDPAAPSTLYAGTNYFEMGHNLGGTVFKSTDGAVTWSDPHTGLFDSAVDTLVIDPSPPHTLYAGPDCNDGPGCGVFRLFRSTDGGMMWDGLAGFPYIRASSFAIDPTTPRTLYAGASDGVFKSTDAGSTWSAALAGLSNVDALAVDPTEPSTLYVGVSGLPPAVSGVFKSTDAGTTWNAASTGLPTNTSVTELVIDPTAPQTLYAGMFPTGEPPYVPGGVFKSTDGGNTWRSVNTGLPNTNIFALAIDSGAPQTLYAGTFYHPKGLDVPEDVLGAVYKSTDAGSTWSHLGAGPNTNGIFALAIDPIHPGKVYAATDGGVFAIEQGAVCVGDCRGTHAVAVSDIVTLVAIAVGDSPLAACPSGVPGEVDVAVIIRAVNNALDECHVG